MSRTFPNPSRVKIHFSFTVEEIARTLNVHKNTVRGWLRAGLEAVDDRRPALIQGKVLRDFLEKKRRARRQPCRPGTLYCLKCRAPRAPAIGMVEFVPLNGSAGSLRALCDQCGTLMHRAAATERVPVLMPNLEVQIMEPEPRLIGMAGPSLNCDSAKE